jgi:hypothetical protein
MFLGGDYHDRDNPRATQLSNKTSSMDSWMQSERDGSTSSSRDDSSKFRWMMTMMMMMIFYGGISTNCTEFQNSNMKRCDDDDGCDGDLHQGRMEDDEDGGTPMLSATGTLARQKNCPGHTDAAVCNRYTRPTKPHQQPAFTKAK